ncbi:hypothetical protein DERP_007555 [Dermatophagoides pteronyssinus]|uniref:Transmembrane protein n=1 Tax=Dermatophagoides pteronyssinus TaxID=6956 RepID=A0ABQ8JK36_DERPT|nr:hypothetical protein DERP_007555 [Dermatophagoides pteronyssinus]
MSTERSNINQAAAAAATRNKKKLKRQILFHFYGLSSNFFLFLLNLCPCLAAEPDIKTKNDGQFFVVVVIIVKT